jgi:hypothetical protein
MKIVKTFEQFNSSERVEEGVLSKLGATALLLMNSLVGLSNDNTHRVTQKIYSEDVMKNKIREGWKLDFIEVDTIYQEVKLAKPDTLVNSSYITLDDSYMSGTIKPSNEQIKKIDDLLNTIEEQNGVIVSVEIISSTDRQGLGNKLKSELIKQGYEGSNKGLSTARNNGICDLLKNDINDSLFVKTIKHDIGEQEVDKDSRYVVVNINYLIISEVEKTTVSAFTTKKKFILSKEFDNKGIKHHKSIKTFKTKIQNIKVTGKPIKCFF